MTKKIFILAAIVLMISLMAQTYTNTCFLINVLNAQNYGDETGYTGSYYTGSGGEPRRCDICIGYIINGACYCSVFYPLPEATVIAQHPAPIGTIIPYFDVNYLYVLMNSWYPGGSAPPGNNSSGYTPNICECCKAFNCVCDASTIKFIDGNNEGRYGLGSLIMVSTNGSPRTARCELMNVDGYIPDQMYPIWFNASGNGNSATGTYSGNTIVSVTLNPNCQPKGGSVEIVPEDLEEIDFNQFVDLYFGSIGDKAASQFASADPPLTSSQSPTWSPSGNVEYIGKNVDQFNDGSNYGRYHELKGSIAYTYGLPEIKSPRVPVFGIPAITFFAYFESSYFEIKGSASAIIDPSKSSTNSGKITITGTAGSIEGGVALDLGVTNVATIRTTGALTISGLSVEGSLNLTSTNITASGKLTIGKVGGEVKISAVFYNSDISFGKWETDKISLTTTPIPLGSGVLYTFNQ